MNSPNPPLDAVVPFEWSDQQSFSYEGALLTVGKALAWYSAEIEHEKNKEQPSAERIARLLEEQKQCATDQRVLRADDPVQVEQIAQTYIQKLDELRGGR